MAYGRFESRRGWREPRSPYSRDEGDRYETRSFDRDDDERERGFFDRAGDEIASWFGDEEAERRRREDARFRPDEDEWRGPRAYRGDDDNNRYDRQARFRGEGYRRPYTGRFAGHRSFGDDDRFERGWSERWERAPLRDFTGTASGLHDPHYSEWRRRQIDALDRDYDEYRRENQNRFESEFSNWRTTRQGKRQLLGQVREHMQVMGSDDEEVGTVDCVRGDRIILTRGDSDDGRHHAISCSMVDRVEGDRVILDQPAAEARRRYTDEGRTSGFFRDEREDERGPHILNRAFSGTYER
ncbi:MAG TPA: DUF2171 domain-containing protein [Sphingomicrobium sp.]|nr:DUF2171 domain-containing protein [Sphingomicrobium sp.]